MSWVAVLVGGAIGSAARYGVNLMMARVFGTPMPYATAAVNLIGSFAVGMLAGALAAKRATLTPVEYTLLVTGVLGGFTTFSSLMLDSLLLSQGGAAWKPLANLVAQFAIGLLLVYAGYRTGLGA